MSQARATTFYLSAFIWKVHSGRRKGIIIYTEHWSGPQNMRTYIGPNIWHYCPPLSLCPQEVILNINTRTYMVLYTSLYLSTKLITASLGPVSYSPTISPQFPLFKPQFTSVPLKTYSMSYSRTQRDSNCGAIYESSDSTWNCGP